MSWRKILKKIIKGRKLKIVSIYSFKISNGEGF